MLLKIDSAQHNIALNLPLAG